MAAIKRNELIKFFEEAYNADGLQTLCFSYSELEAVEKDIEAQPKMNMKFITLIRYVEQKEIMDRLLEILKEDRPEKYQKFFPEEAENTAEETAPALKKEKELYEYFLNFQIDLRIKIRKSTQNQNFNVFCVLGKSIPIVSLNHPSIKREHIWFTEHILPYCIYLAKSAHNFLQYLDSKHLFSPFTILEELAKGLGEHDFEEIAEANQQTACDAVSRQLKLQIDSKSVVLPIFIREKHANLSFIEDFVAEILPQIDLSLETKHAFILLLLFENELNYQEIRFPERIQEIKINTVENESFENWAEDPKGFFIKEEDFSKPFLDQPKDCLSDCRTQEQVFGNISEKLFPAKKFQEFLQNNYFKRYT